MTIMHRLPKYLFEGVPSFPLLALCLFNTSAENLTGHLDAPPSGSWVNLRPAGEQNLTPESAPPPAGRGLK